MNYRNPVIFPFPAVQYIPLAITNLMEGSVPNILPEKQQVKLIAGPELLSWRHTLSRDYGITIPSAFPALIFPVLGINLKITEVKYRSFFVTMLGAVQPGHYQLFTIPTDRIYKSKLYFQVFDQGSAEKLAECSLFMPQIALPKPAVID